MHLVIILQKEAQSFMIQPAADAENRLKFGEFQSYEFPAERVSTDVVDWKYK